MQVFQDIELEWNDRVFTIKHHRVMGAIARIEDVITLGELQRYGANEALPVGKLCMAFGAVLRYAGAQVRDAEIYEAMFSSEHQQQAISAAIVNLMQMMLPPSARAKLEAGEIEADAEGSASGNSPATALSASSNKRTKRRSRKANG